MKEKGNNRAAFWRDFWALILLVFILVALFLPYLLGGRGLFLDDMALEVFPRLYYSAQQLQNGEILLCRPAIWCGARIYFTEFISHLYYLPRLPFLLCADLGDIDNAYFWLALVPLFLHYLIGGIGVYCLLRRSLSLRPLPALLSGTFYMLSPVFIYALIMAAEPCLLAWVPWLLLVYSEQVSRFRPWLFLPGGIIVYLMSTAGIPQLFGYSLLTLAFVCGGLVVKRFLGKSDLPAWRPPVILLAYLVSGFFLAAVYWLPALEGVRSVQESEILSYDFIAGGDASLPPAYLATLFAPDLFGGMTGVHVWGNAFAGTTRYWEANMSGGVAVTLLALLGAILPWTISGRDAFSKRLRFGAVIAALVYLFAIVCVLGRHSFLYHLICCTIPFLSQFPYPIRYRMMQCLAASVLAGLGLQFLFGGCRRISRAFLERVTGYYLLAACLVVGLVLILPNDLTGELPGQFENLNRGWAFPGFLELLYRGDSEWFLRGPFLTFLGGILIIVLAVRFVSVRGFALIIAALAFFETGSNAYQAFYYATFDRRVISPQHERVREPSSHPIYRRMLVNLPELISEPLLRIATDWPFHDNLQQFQNGFALMGYDMKPLDPRFREAIEDAYGQPMDWSIYLSQPRLKHLSFLSNKSVGYLLDTNPESPFSGGGTESLKSSPGFYLHTNPEALPRAFTVDRIVETAPREQLDWLVEGDIRRAVFMTKAPLKVGIGAEVFTYKEFLDLEEGESGAAFDDHFEKLQQANKINSLELGNPNSVELEIEVALPAMLVLTEVWHPGWEARVDGKETKLYRVNYCQRGVWLESGKHRVELKFRPRIWMVGAGVSIFSWAALIIVALVLWIKKRIGRQKAQNKSK